MGQSNVSWRRGSVPAGEVYRYDRHDEAKEGEQQVGRSRRSQGGGLSSESPPRASEGKAASLRLACLGSAGKTLRDCLGS